MAQKIVFQSAVLLGFGRNLKKATANFSSSLTKSVISAMAWTDIPECATGASLDGELGATLLLIDPKEKELEKHGIELKVSRVFDFEIVRLELVGTKQGKGHRQELRFKVALNDADACKKLERWMMTIGDAKGSLTVHYEPEPVQAPLPGAGVEDQEPLSGVQ